ncbi:MAG: hypothetical protein M1814_006021 [Vezdaea aestivalis]|nr:MAG: hypothetical protein M1814_006021 [Vezdaea aestivalis]
MWTIETCRKKPVEEFFEDAYQKFMNLVWFPEPDRGNMIGDVENSMWNKPTSDADPAEIRGAKNRVNEYRAVRKLYVDHGWPDAFDGEAFVRAFKDFRDTLFGIETTAKKQYTMRMAAEGKQRQYGLVYVPGEQEAREPYLMRMAGD